MTRNSLQQQIPVLYFDDLSPPSRSCLMLIDFLKVNVKLVFVDLLAGEHLKPLYELVNPQCTVPTLVHGNYTVTEGDAILIYLCEHYYKGKYLHRLYPICYPLRLRILSRLFFKNSVLNARHCECMADIVRKSLSGSEFESHKTKVLAAYKCLNIFLSEHKYLAAAQFTLADISIACTLGGLDLIFPIEDYKCRYPNLYRWFQCVRVMPAYVSTLGGIARQVVALSKFGEFEVLETLNNLPFDAACFDTASSHSRLASLSSSIKKEEHTKAKDSATSVKSKTNKRNKRNSSTRRKNVEFKVDSKTKTSLHSRSKGGSATNTNLPRTHHILMAAAAFLENTSMSLDEIHSNTFTEGCENPTDWLAHETYDIAPAHETCDIAHEKCDIAHETCDIAQETCDIAPANEATENMASPKENTSASTKNAASRTSVSFQKSVTMRPKPTKMMSAADSFTKRKKSAKSKTEGVIKKKSPVISIKKKSSISSIVRDSVNRYKNKVKPDTTISP